jgi:ATP-binding cassette subfamily F protein 3
VARAGSQKETRRVNASRKEPGASPKNTGSKSGDAAAKGAGSKPASEPLKPAASIEKPVGKEDYARRKEAEKAVRKVTGAIAAAEKRIGELEADIAAWDARLADPAAHGIDMADGKVFAAYNELKTKLSHEMHEWEKLNYELDILTDEN